MRRILPLATLALMLADADAARAQSPGCNYGTGSYGSGAYGTGSYGGYGGYAGGGSQPGYYRQSLYTGSPIGFFSFAMRMYPLIHFHGPLVNYGPYEGYYPFQPYGPWTSDLKYAGPPVPSHPHFYYGPSNPGTGWIGGGHGKSCEWGRYALATFHNVGLRTHGCGHKGKTCSASAEKTVDVMLTAGE